MTFDIATYMINQYLKCLPQKIGTIVPTPFDVEELSRYYHTVLWMT